LISINSAVVDRVIDLEDRKKQQNELSDKK